MKIFSKILKYLITLVILIAFFNFALYLTSLIPSQLLRNNVEESAKQLENQGGYYEILGKYVILDNYMDALMINEAYSVDYTNPLESYLKVRKNYDKDITKYEVTDEIGDLKTYSNNIIDENGKPQSDDCGDIVINYEKDDKAYLATKYNTILELKNFIEGKVNISANYVRYYHGYLVYLRPLLMLFNINQIRIITLVLFLLLLGILAYQLNIKLGKFNMFAIVFSLLIFELLFIPFSIDFAPGFIIAMLFSILLLININKINWDTFKYLCFICGAIICYFDYLNVPVLTFVLPMLIFVLYYIKEKNIDDKKLFKDIFITCVLWSIGYIITWVSKWIIYDIFMDNSIISMVIEQIKYRSISEPHKFLECFYYIIIHFATGAILSIVVSFFIKKEAYNIDTKLKNKKCLLFICVIPIIWDIVTFNHFINHSFFTYRDLIPVFVGIWLFYFDSQSKNCVSKKESKKNNKIKEKKTKKLSIVMPVYNEKDLIIKVLEKVKQVKIDNTDIELIVVDDCSTDGTTKILKEHGMKYANKVLFHDINQGKGASLKTGFKEANGDVVIVQDADFEYDPMEIPLVVEPVFNNEADVCYGSRFLNKEYKGYTGNQIANKVLTRLSNIMTGLNVTDMETCYKAFKTDFIKNIDIKEKRFGFEPEITAKVAHAKLKLKEVPISYYPRTKEEGKKINVKDGIRALYCIAKYR